MVRSGSLAICLVAGVLFAAAPAHGAFPGKPGPIAYSFVQINEGEDSGGLQSHGPRRRDLAHQLTDDPGDSSPSYSADGRSIAFSGNRDPGPERRGAHIYVMSRSGAGVRQLTSGAFYDSNPAFSRDGRTIVFDRTALNGGPAQIYSVPVAGGTERAITAGGGSSYDPTFTPNGRRIVFVSNRRSSGRRDRSNIFSMRPNGTGVRLLIGGPRNELDPDVSPNGRWIAFASNRNHGPNLFVARINGRHVRQLTHSRHDCFGSACYTNPAWAPDGKHIAYLATGRYSSSIDVIRADGRGSSKEFDSGGTEEEGFGSRVAAPSWGSRPR